VLNEAITWLDIHGDRPDAVEHWRALQNDPAGHPHGAGDEAAEAPTPYPRRRRRRRRRGAQRVTGNS
jgi:anti-sigma factor RsiW